MDANEEKFDNLRTISLGFISSALGEKILLFDKTFGEKIQFFENLMYKQNVFDDIEKKCKLLVEKDDNESLKYRNIGNDYYSKNDYLNALKSYNQSICFSTLSSSNIGIGYSNRSVIFHQMKLYEKCLNNISLAKECNNLPEKILNKIHQRELDCLKHLNNNNNNNNENSTTDKNSISNNNSSKPDKLITYLKLCCNNNPLTPYPLADCLDIKLTDKMGRGIFTTRDLQAGDLIGIEEMFSWTIMDECKYSKCLNCMKENYLILIPCPNCTCAMFCSKKCLDEGTNKFHQYECSIINFMYDYLPSNFILTIRTLLNVINEFSTIKDCYTTCVQSVTKNIYGDEATQFNFKDYKYCNGINLLNSIYYDKSDAMAFFPYVPIIALLKYFLIRKTKLKNLVIEKEHQDFLSEAMLLYTRIIQDSSYGSKIIFSEDSPEFQFLCPFESLFNHSCNPNVEHWIIGKKVYFLLLHPAKKGMQLLINYCPDFGTLSKEHRIMFLESRNFVCTCEACLKDYPTFNIEKAKNHKPKLYTREFNTILSNMGKINDMTPKQAYTYLKQCSKFMEKYYNKFFPDQPIILIERLITRIISKLLDEQSMKNIVKKKK